MKQNDGVDCLREPDEMPSRNETEGFAARTRKNLDFVIAAHENGADVHVVTQLVLSLLGIVVFPVERLAPWVWEVELSGLQQNGWPEWNHTRDGYQPRTLGALLRVLRHAIAHGNVAFSSDSRLLREVTVSFKNLPPRGGRCWAATIPADELLEFCRRYLDLMWDAVA